jgi:hypothetical protein
MLSSRGRLLKMQSQWMLDFMVQVNNCPLLSNEPANDRANDIARLFGPLAES